MLAGGSIKGPQDYAPIAELAGLFSLEFSLCAFRAFDFGVLLLALLCESNEF